MLYHEALLIEESMTKFTLALALIFATSFAAAYSYAADVVVPKAKTEIVKNDVAKKDVAKPEVKKPTKKKAAPAAVQKKAAEKAK